MVREKHPCFHRYLVVSGERGTVPQWGSSSCRQPLGICEGLARDPSSCAKGVVSDGLPE